jgi:hypothetical protein
MSKLRRHRKAAAERRPSQHREYRGVGAGGQARTGVRYLVRLGRDLAVFSLRLVYRDRMS